VSPLFSRGGKEKRDSCEGGKLRKQGELKNWGGVLKIFPFLKGVRLKGKLYIFETLNKNNFFSLQPEQSLNPIFPKLRMG
jgi:hypothetical protein